MKYQGLNEYIENCYNAGEFDNIVLDYQMYMSGEAYTIKCLSNLIEYSVHYWDNPSMFILPNEEGCFDLFITSATVVKAEHLNTSNAFINGVVNKGIDGSIIENLKEKDVKCFLKAYYIYRKRNEELKDTCNIEFQYSDNYFNIEKFEPKFTEQKINEFTIYYNGLPLLDFEYLDNEKFFLSLNNLSFKDILIGTYQSKVFGTNFTLIKKRNCNI